MGPPVDAPKDPLRKAHSHHDSDGESSIENPVDLESQHIFKEIRMKRKIEQDADSSTNSTLEVKLQRLIKVVMDSSNVAAK